MAHEVPPRRHVANGEDRRERAAQRVRRHVGDREPALSLELPVRPVADRGEDPRADVVRVLAGSVSRWEGRLTADRSDSARGARSAASPGGTIGTFRSPASDFVDPARPVVRGHRHVRRYVPGGMPTTTRAPIDRVADRQRAVLLARHCREAEGLTIAQIAQRLGRSAATVKGYFYDPSYAGKRPSRLAAAAGCSERTTRRSGADNGPRSTRLPQPWHCARPPERRRSSSPHTVLERTNSIGVNDRGRRPRVAGAGPPHVPLPVPARVRLPPVRSKPGVAMSRTLG